MDWLSGVLGLLSLWLVGRKNRIGWIVGIASQIPMAYVIYKTSIWGLVPFQTGLLILSFHNWKKWGKNNEH